MSSMRSSSSGGGGGFLGKNNLFCVIFTKFLSHWAKLFITDSLSRVETNNICKRFLKVAERK